MIYQARFPRSVRYIWLLLLFITPCYAQQSKTDSLKQKLQQATHDTVRLKILQKLSASPDPSLKFYYARIAKTLAEKLHNDKALVDAEISMGTSSAIRGKLDSALYYFSVAYNDARQANYELGMAKSLSNTGFTYDQLDDKKEAINYYFQAYTILKKLNNKKYLNQAIINIGSLYFDLHQYKTAETYYAQCLKNATEDKDEAGIGYALYTLGGCYYATNQNDKALDYLGRSLEIREKLGDINGSALVKRAIGIAYRNKKQYDMALKNLLPALDSMRTLKNKYEESAVLTTLAGVYTDMHEYDKAISAGLASLKLGYSIKSKLAAIDALDKLVPAYKGNHQIDKAFEYQTLYIKTQDSLLTEKALKDVNQTEFIRIRSENATLSKDNKIIASKNTDYLTRLNQYSNAIIITLIILGTVTLLLVVFYRRNAQKQATNKLLEQQKEEIATINEELRTQMELTTNQNTELEKLNEVKNKFFSIISHDIRGPLSTLQSLFMIYREGAIGKDELGMLLTQLEDTILTTGAFLDNLLEWSKNQLDGMIIQPQNFSISECIAENIHLFSSKISLKKLNIINLSIRPVLVYADENMINLVIRNLLSNSIKFCKPGDRITLSTEIIGKTVIIGVKDTGPGISDTDREKLFKLEHTVSSGSNGEKGNHLGLILCKDMIDQNNGKIWFETKEGAGTTFWIELPLGTT
ncbi:tetratricopeptide repeat-containing sensor histidine kinase [Mucilaginibacter sp. HMF5004]|uniref:tetratricopeptide repeat-containing sensor histidine kinase n=1 Tax=Mucilaginibacter rivuli TaxID=2857527 RepID=UPI001C5DE8FE|nr:tetratricopeptide repeat protein [Mucilaginibacter rivuli]MBW4889440.1 tetratricopeptide repeat-containing sensor histidine kinase [Mucilaginibacter rivuli]